MHRLSSGKEKNMNWFTVLLAVALFPAQSAFAANFTPTVLGISAPAHVQYHFDGSILSLPVNVTGTPAGASLLVFTSDRGVSIGRVRSGHLGWHSIDSIDTCVYTSPFRQLTAGANTMVWDGRDESGNPVRAGNYTYYIWGFNNVSARVQMTKCVAFDPWLSPAILTHDPGGNALSRPVWYTGNNNRSASPGPVDHTISKWVVGSDPENDALRETTLVKGWCAAGGIAFQPDDPRYFFHDTLKGDTNTKVTRKWEWVPNGASILQTGWGVNGEFTYTGAWPAGTNCGPGVAGDGAGPQAGNAARRPERIPEPGRSSVRAWGEAVAVPDRRLRA
jgi:hypothetical protein